MNNSKPVLTLDEFFNYTKFPSLTFSPNGQYLLIQKNRPSWNSNSYENSLWLYEIKEQQKQLITSQLDPSFRPRWSSNGKRILFSREKPMSLKSGKNQRLIAIYRNDNRALNRD
ncbi:unnamed protein product [Rotaria sp. Silwood1]|nr:unnamed protein product [Rotaria sp. Silwood1]